MSEDMSGGTMAALLEAEKEQSLQPSNQATNDATKQPSNRPLKKGDILESIRVLVKEVGKETTSYRLHESEKEAIYDALYSLKKRGFKTSENEAMRIAINYLLIDYDQHGDESIWVKVLERLSA